MPARIAMIEITTKSSIIVNFLSGRQKDGCLLPVRFFIFIFTFHEKYSLLSVFIFFETAYFFVENVKVSIIV